MKEERAVDRRESTLQREYVDKARRVDKDYGGTLDGHIGRVERELAKFGTIQGLVFGAWGEASKGVHELVETLANCRVRSQSIQSGKEQGEGEKSIIVGQIRRCLSVAVVRANATCLLDRLHQVGKGVATANVRREKTQWEADVMRRERENEWSARVGRNFHSRGLFFKS